MNEQRNKEINEYLAELSAIVDLYNPKEGLGVVVPLLSSQLICLIVIWEVGLFWGLVLLGLVIVPVGCYFAEGKSHNKNSPSQKELAEGACILMSRCVNCYKYPGDDPLSAASRMILSYSSYRGNLPLYQEFVALFPEMASKKLKKLAEIKLKD